MFKKTMVLAMAAAAVAAIALPSVAMAQNWTHHNEELSENEEIQLTGQTKWIAGAVGSIECQITSSLTLKANQTTGTMTQYDVDLDQEGSTVTNRCSAGGFLASCQVHSLQSIELPWTIHNETQEIAIESGDIRYTLGGSFCPAKKATMKAADPEAGHTITYTPNQPTTVTTFTESGQIEVDLFSSHQSEEPFRTSTAGTAGSLTILGEDKHTYSLE